MKKTELILLTIFLSLVILTHLSAQTETTKWYYELDGVTGVDEQNNIQNQSASSILKLINTERIPVDLLLDHTLRELIETDCRLRNGS